MDRSEGANQFRVVGIPEFVGYFGDSMDIVDVMDEVDIVDGGGGDRCRNPVTMQLLQPM